MKLLRKQASEDPDYLAMLRDIDARLYALLNLHKHLTLKARRALLEKDARLVNELEVRLVENESLATSLREQRDDVASKLHTLTPYHATTSTASPRLGERMLLLVLRTKEERANIPGDLEEEYRGIAAKHGGRYAKLWYYKQVAASAWPLIRKAIGLGLMTSLGAWLRRYI